MIDSFPLSFFLLLVVHVLAGLMTGITGIMAFCVHKRTGQHHRWGTGYVWAYTAVFLTATVLSILRWEADAYLFFLAMAGFGLILGSVAAQRFGRDLSVGHTAAKLWLIVHIIGMIGSYVVLWTAFFVDNAHRIPGLNRLPSLTFWVLPTAIGLPFAVFSIIHSISNGTAPGIRPGIFSEKGRADETETDRLLDDHRSHRV